MRVMVTTEARFATTPDGRVWTQTMFARPYWDNYLEVFDEVVVVARCKEVSAPSEGWVRMDGGPVSAVAVPHYVGPLGLLRRSASVLGTVADASSHVSAAILRVPSLLGGLVERRLHRRGVPFAVEVVADPLETFGPGGVRHPFSPLFRRWFARELRRQCSEAVAAAYVTEAALQRLYPPAQGAYTTHFSSIVLSREAIAPRAREYGAGRVPDRLVVVANLSQAHKGIDVLLQALQRLRAHGQTVSLSIVGGGALRQEYEALATELGVSDQVHFHGQLTSGKSVRDVLDASDLFVFPSRAEGLPRALIEAMARGLPCLGSPVGGVAELLPPRDLVPVGDAEALAKRIEYVLSDPELLQDMAQRNLERSKEYAQEVLTSRRRMFYSAYREGLES